VSFTTISLCVASQRMFIVIIVVVYFVTMQSGNFWIYPHKVTTYTCIGTGSWNTYIRNDRKVFYTVYSVPHYVCVYVCMCVGVCVCVCVCVGARARYLVERKSITRSNAEYVAFNREKSEAMLFTRWGLH
jgi:hypothetical protein